MPEFLHLRTEVGHVWTLQILRPGNTFSEALLLPEVRGLRVLQCWQCGELQAAGLAGVAVLTAPASHRLYGSRVSQC